MLNYSFILSLLLTGTVISISSQFWIVIWLGMEINTYAFISLVKKGYDFSFKYYSIQALGSFSYLYSYMFAPWGGMELLFLFSMTMKIMAVPFFHFIYPSIKKMNTLIIYIFFSWQKILPFCLIYNMDMKSLEVNFIMFLFFINGAFGYLGLKNKTQMIDILMHSSVYQLSWVILSFSVSKYIFKLFFLTYLMIIYLFMLMHTNKKFFGHGYSTVFYMWMIFLFLSGFPPTLIFLFKIMIMKEVLSIYSMIMIFMSMMLVVGFTVEYLKLINLTVHKKLNFFFYYYPPTKTLFLTFFTFFLFVTVSIL